MFPLNIGESQTHHKWHWLHIWYLGSIIGAYGAFVKCGHMPIPNTQPFEVLFLFDILQLSFVSSILLPDRFDRDHPGKQDSRPLVLLLSLPFWQVVRKIPGDLCLFEDQSFVTVSTRKIPSDHSNGHQIAKLLSMLRLTVLRKSHLLIWFIWKAKNQHVQTSTNTQTNANMNTGLFTWFPT